MSDDDALHVALRLKALADPVRVKLVSLLLTSAEERLCTSELAEAVGLAESTISHHLGQMRKAGIVTSERSGMNVYHQPSRGALDALRAVLNPHCC
jgi:ArsR family transcriptional regulator